MMETTESLKLCSAFMAGEQNRVVQIIMHRSKKEAVLLFAEMLLVLPNNDKLDLIMSLHRWEEPKDGG